MTQAVDGYLPLHYGATPNRITPWPEHDTSQVQNKTQVRPPQRMYSWTKGENPRGHETDRKCKDIPRSSRNRWQGVGHFLFILLAAQEPAQQETVGSCASTKQGHLNAGPVGAFTDRCELVQLCANVSTGAEGIRTPAKIPTKTALSDRWRKIQRA